MDKCPKCGAESYGERRGRVWFACDSKILGDGSFDQSLPCRVKELEALLTAANLLDATPEVAQAAGEVLRAALADATAIAKLEDTEEAGDWRAIAATGQALRDAAKAYAAAREAASISTNQGE